MYLSEGTAECEQPMTSLTFKIKRVQLMFDWMVTSQDAIPHGTSNSILNTGTVFAVGGGVIHGEIGTTKA
jgi:hypothetical protein